MLPVEQTAVLKNGLTHHDIHYWLGKDAKEVCWLILSNPHLHIVLPRCLYFLLLYFCSSIVRLTLRWHPTRQSSWMQTWAPVPSSTGKSRDSRQRSSCPTSSRASYPLREFSLPSCKAWEAYPTGSRC